MLIDWPDKMANNKFIYVPQGCSASGDTADGGAAARSSGIGVGASSRTSTGPPVNSTATHNPDSVPSFNNAFQLVSATNNIDRTSQAVSSSNTGERFSLFFEAPSANQRAGENRRVPQSADSVEASLPQSAASISPSSCGPRSNPMSSVTLDPNAGRVRWNRELHRPQLSASIGAFAESSRDAEVRLTRQDAEAENRRVITAADYDDDHEIDEDDDVRSEDIHFVIGSDYGDEQEGDSDNGDEDAEHEDVDGKHEAVEDEAEEHDVEEPDVPKRQHAVNKGKRVVTSNKRIRISGREAERRQLENEKNQDLTQRSKEDAQRPLLVAEGVTCSFGDCTLKSPFRRTISAFFGRNKKGGRDVPVRIWLHICRKHYQRTKYRDKDKYVNAQCDRIETQFDRLEEWSNATLDANQGPHIDYWTIVLGKKEADYQASQKNADGAKAKAAQVMGKGKTPNLEEDKDKPFIKEEAIDDIFDEKDNIWHAPAWLVALQGRRLSFKEIRKVFARLRLETQYIPNRTLPQVEFLPHLIFLGNYQPKKVTYNKRNPKQGGPKKKASPRKSNANGKSKATAIKIEESDHEEDEDDHYMDEFQEEEDYDDVMADTDENYEYHRRKREDYDDEDDQEYQRRRPAVPVRRNNYEMADFLVQSGGFEILPRQTPTPSQRHMDVQQPRAPLPAPAPVERVRYVPRWQRPENNPPPVQDEVEDEVDVYQPPLFTPRGPAKKNYIKHSDKGKK